MRQLRFPLTTEEVISTLAFLNLHQCKDFLEKEQKRSLELKTKIFWLEVDWKNYEEAMTVLDKPDFLTLANVLEKGKLDYFKVL